MVETDAAVGTTLSGHRLQPSLSLAESAAGHECRRQKAEEEEEAEAEGAEPGLDCGEEDETEEEEPESETSVAKDSAPPLRKDYFRKFRIPVIFTAVSANADHGYVFVQESGGPCFGCLFPDAIDSRCYPCPATPAIVDILQAIGALAVYAVDTCLMQRPRNWNYRRLYLSDCEWDTGTVVGIRAGCSCVTH